MKNIKIILITVLLVFISTDFINSQSMSSARAMALGSAHTSLAVGVDAAKFNPANLGLLSHRQNGIELLGVGANVTNNSFTLDDYNKYTGAFLTTDDKNDILSKIPKEGLKLSMDAEASVFSLAMGSFVFSAYGVGLADINLNKDVMDLILNGNVYADTIDFSGSYSEALAYGAASISYGRPVYKAGDRQLAIGATFSYLRGIGVEKVIEMNGMAATFATGFQGSGNIKIQTASGGTGYALDLGASLKLNKNYTVGARIKNFLSALNWNNGTEEHGYIFDFDTMTIDNMNADYVTSDDYSKPIAAFSTNLPSVLNVGIAKTSGSILWAVDWEQGFRSETGASTRPRISGGLEWQPIGFLPLRMGYSTGGDKNSSFSFGSGFHFPVLYMDFAIVSGNSFSGSSSKGLNFAFTAGLNF